MSETPSTDEQITTVQAAVSYLDDLIAETYGGGPDDEAYIREDERLRSLSFARGLVRAALEGIHPYDYVDSDRAAGDIVLPARCTPFTHIRDIPQ